MSSGRNSAQTNFRIATGTDSISAVGPHLRLSARDGSENMEENPRSAEDVVEELTEFARRHNLMLPRESCLNAHAAKYVKLGHCPCDERRPSCPCDEALFEIETIGRCECGVLLDPVRLLNNNKVSGDSKPD